MNTTTHHRRPLREHTGHQTAADIQRDIDMMRRMYDRREPLNRRRTPISDELATYLFAAVAMAIPAVAAIAIFFL
jgi:hypothetical protein